MEEKLRGEMEEILRGRWRRNGGEVEVREAGGEREN
jgi:hypothetical protein